MRRIEKRKRVCYFITMNEKFYDLSKEKQDRMLNGGIQVFAQAGYRHASTDEMVKATGVSKGLWFHYFDNKKGLYHYVCSYGIRYALLEISMKIDDGIVDYFDLKKKLEEVKISLVDKYPYLPLLLTSIMDESDEEVDVSELSSVAGGKKCNNFDICEKKINIYKYYTISVIQEKTMENMTQEEFLQKIQSFH